jgi:hypothetical protein
MTDGSSARDALHDNVDDLWDAIAMLEGAINVPTFKDESPYPFRLARMALEKLKSFEHAVSSVV